MQSETQKINAAQDDANSHFSSNFNNENKLTKVEPEKEISLEAQQPQSKKMKITVYVNDTDYHSHKINQHLNNVQD